METYDNKDAHTDKGNVTTVVYGNDYNDMAEFLEKLYARIKELCASK